MSFDTAYRSTAPTRAEIDALPGRLLLEFGTGWCGHCRRAQPLIEAALNAYPDVQHIKIEDGSGRPLGRSFRVTLWPTLVFLRNGEETGRLVRPQGVAAIDEELARQATPS